MDSLQSLRVMGLLFVWGFFGFVFFFNGNLSVAGLVAVRSGCLTCLASTVWSGSWSLVKRGQKRGYPGLCQVLLNFKSSKCESWEDAINL